MIESSVCPLGAATLLTADGASSATDFSATPRPTFGPKINESSFLAQQTEGAFLGMRPASHCDSLRNVIDC
jgi:hypothetical protein